MDTYMYVFTYILVYLLHTIHAVINAWILTAGSNDCWISTWTLSTKDHIILGAYVANTIDHTRTYIH
jgi:hypothetical protein